MTPSRVHGRYAIYDAASALGSGAAATVHLGVSRGRETVPVAIKRLHAGQARQPAAALRLLDEVRLARHIVHPNVVRTIDFVSDGEEMLAIMEYVHGEPLSRLLADAREHGVRLPVPIAIRIALDVLHGLQAAHLATDGEGKPLQLVHRDVTPENILVGLDGLARLMDFGVAKAEGRLHATRDGGVRGKLAYLAPEQIGGEVSARTDLYAAGLVLWEMLAGERAISGENEGELLVKALDPHIPPASARNPDVPSALDDAIARAIAKDPGDRFRDALEQAAALAQAALCASPAEVSAWVGVHGGERLAIRGDSVHAMLAAEEPSMSGAILAPAAEDPSALGHQLRGLAVMIAAAVVVVVIALAWRARDARLAAEAEVAPATAPPVLPPVQPPVVAPIATPTIAALPEAPPEVSSGRRITPPPPRVRPAARPAQPSCDPPWTLDAHGIRRYDPACVK